MFTGLIEEIGTIKKINSLGGGKHITVSAGVVLEGSKIDDSIAINGVCQTVIDINRDGFSVIAIEETLAKSTLGSMKSGQKVNLERAMTLATRLGGHLVQGHVDCRGTILSIERLATAVNLWISFPQNFARLVVDTGSICIDGISLTTAKVHENKFMVSIIPHTWKSTTLSDLTERSSVNLEFDILGKYIQRMYALGSDEKIQKTSILDKFINQPQF